MNFSLLLSQVTTVDLERPTVVIESLVLPSKKIPLDQKNLLQSLSPVALSLEELTREDYIKVKNQKVFITKQVKVITALRVILSMIREGDNDLSWLDLITIYELVLKIEKTLIGQVSFLQKYGSTLKVLTSFLMETPLGPRSVDRFLRAIKVVLKSIPDQFFINSRNLQTEKLKMRENIFLVSIKPDGTELKYLPPKAFIGKGYGDKGAKRKPELDGNPTWQEVATSKLPREIKKEYEEFLRGL